MSVTSQKTTFSIAPQSSAIGLNGVFNPASYNWHRFKTTSLSGFENQIQQVMPDEMGGGIVPTGAYKSAAMIQGEVSLIPRLENTIGYLLYAAIGTVTTVSGKRWTASGWVNAPGIHGHLFRFNPNDHASIPWFAARRDIPGTTSGENFGSVGWDVKVQGLSLNIPASSLIGANVSFMGRQFKGQTPAQVNAWTYANAFEDARSVAHSGGAGDGSGMLVEGANPKITNLSIELINELSQELIVGSYFLDDITVLRRLLTARATYKWQNATLFNKLFNGGGSNTEWDILPYIIDTIGNQKAFFFEAQSANNIPNTSSPYAIRIMGNKVGLQLDRGTIPEQAGELIEFSVGINFYDADSNDYIEIALDNNVASYAWS